MPDERRSVRTRKSDKMIEKIRSYMYVVFLFLIISGFVGTALIKAYVFPGVEKIAVKIVEEHAFPLINGKLLQKDIDHIKEKVDATLIKVDAILEKINKDKGE